MTMVAQPGVLKVASGPPKKAEDWTRSIHRLIKSMNHDLTLLFDGVEDSSEADATADSTEETGLPSDTPLPAVAQAFVEHCQSLGLFLSTPTSGLVKLPMSSMIDVLSRCLKVSSADLKSRPSLSELADLLPGLHQAALLMLAQLIICCGSHVLPRSRAIVDMSVRALAGAKHTKVDAKCTTRACAFQVLSLMVTMFGWGKYMQSVLRVLVQDLVSDLQIQDAPKMDPASKTDQESTPSALASRQDVDQIAQRKGKKKKKGKKQKGDSYNDLSAPGSENKGSLNETELFNEEATHEALKLSRVILKRAEFSQVEVLVRCLLETSRTLQREGPSRTSPYSAEGCRQMLYDVVLCCAAVRLGRDSSRKDTISHFQASNLALSLLTAAAHSDTSTHVRNDCGQLIVLLRSIGSMSPPVVRKIMPDEHIQSDIQDVSEVEKDVERLSEENKDLWKQLVDAQVEVDAQRRELEGLRKAARETSAQLEDGTAPYKAVNGNTELSKEEGEEEETFVEEEEEVATLECDEAEKQAQLQVSQSEEKLTKSKSSPSPSKASKKKKKRSVEGKPDEVQEAKKLKVDATETPKPTPSSSESSGPAAALSEENTLVAEDVEAMISDFVDAAADGS